MTRTAVLALGAALACSGGPRTTTAPAPRASATTPTSPAASPEARILYRLAAPLSYEIRRYDSIAFQSINAGVPQVTGRRAHLSVRPDNGGRIDVVLDSIVGVLGHRLAASALDSAQNARFELRLSSTGPSGSLKATPETVLVGQIAAALRLLFPQLPKSGVGSGDAWGDSTSYQIRLDAFEATETASRTSKASRGGSGGVRVEGLERLTRKGKSKQGGREMGLSGSGVRQVTYDLAPEGWVSFLIARDSLDLIVTVPDTPGPIPVRWRSTIVARLRGPSPG
jgi:hypothetical protein